MKLDVLKYCVCTAWELDGVDVGRLGCTLWVYEKDWNLGSGLVRLA
jgi:hypothetical protein